MALESEAASSGVRRRRRSHWRDGRESLVFAVLGGIVVGILGSSGGIPGLVVAVAIGGAVAVAAAGDIGGEALVPAALITAVSTCYALVFHHSPDITLLEVIVLPSIVTAIVRERAELAASFREEALVRLFVWATLGMLTLGALYVFWRPAGLGAGPPMKELGKNLELAVLAVGTLAYTTSVDRFARAYTMLALIALVSSAQALAKVQGHAFSWEALGTQAPLIFIVLAVPFANRLPTAGLIGACGVLLIVARTRGAWILAVLLALAVVLRQRRRRIVDRGTIAVIGSAIAAGGLAVAIIPKIRSRFTGLVSGHDVSVGTRGGMVRAGIHEGAHHLLTGVGPGQFKPWMLVHGSPVDFRIGLAVIPLDPHNVFVKFFAEEGLPGLMVFVAWAAAVIGAVILAWRRLTAGGGALPEDDLKPYVVGFALYTPIFAASFLISEWGSLTRIQIGVAAGMALALLRFSPSRGRPRRNRR